MITAIFDVLIKMSVQGVVMIMIILIVRFVLKQLQINHKYLVGLWLIVFFYLIFPWKVSLPIGFWGNISSWEEMQMVSGKEGSFGNKIADNILQMENQTENKESGIEIRPDILLQENIEDIFSDKNTKENGCWK